MPGSAAVLESGAQSLWVQTQSDEPLKIGDQAEATGLPNSSGGFLSLSGAEIRDTNVQAPIAPHPATWQELTSGQRQYDLVSIEGQVVMQVREATQDEYVLHSGSYLFSAIYRHANTAEVGGIAPLREIPVGSTIRLTGVCILNDARAYNHNASFNILLRSPDDIAVVARPPWFNLRHVTLLAGLLLFIVLTIGIRGWFLESRTRRQIGSLAYIEQRRSRILEAINASRPLSQTIEQITELVSCKLGGAPCWCNITDGATLGNRPAKLAPSLRTVERPIASRSGPPLGSIFAAFDARSIPNPLEAETLEKSAELATLAIETSRLYSDLVHRSEFDLLTDAQNRFAMEKALDAMVQNARRAAGIFGLIYIDLNEFKKVNDLHGHLVGDLYLQEAAQRMKRQLRPGDTLARLGGDEFAVLVPSVRNRAEVEEIAARLEDCFSTPFLGEEYALNGSASLGIALYPEDADSADELLSAADAAMYEAKFSRTGRSRAAQV
jgi:diguanylate cyclase (GGDEF)-like protein